MPHLKGAGANEAVSCRGVVGTIECLLLRIRAEISFDDFFSSNARGRESFRGYVVLDPVPQSFEGGIGIGAVPSKAVINTGSQEDTVKVVDARIESGD
jgi:hypothetical protein